jgi:transcriptional regulator with XRE-family HTH domain
MTEVSQSTDNEALHTPHPVDVHVGSRIRLRRRLLGLSQEKLAEALGLTFQQVQKYERGSNRVSASKLYEISRTLQTPVTFFYEGLPDSESGAPIMRSGVSPASDLLLTSDGPSLAAAFSRIRSEEARRKLLDLIKILAD